MCTHLVQAGIHHFIADSFQVIRHLKPGFHKVAQLFVGHDIPDAIARQDHKLILFWSTNHLKHFRFRAHQLLCRALPIHTLVVIVPQGSWYCQWSIYPLNHHRAASILDALPLAWVARLVVVCGEAHVWIAVQNSSRIATVNEEEMIRWQEDSHGCGTTAVQAISKVREAAHVLVNPQEARPDPSHHGLHCGRYWCWRVTGGTVWTSRGAWCPSGPHASTDYVFQKMLRAVVGNPRASVTIIDSKKWPVSHSRSRKSQHSCMSIFHLHPPTLHGTEPVAQAIAFTMRVVLLRLGFVQESTHGCALEACCFLRGQKKWDRDQ